METIQRPDTASVDNPTRLTPHVLQSKTSPEPVVTAEQPAASAPIYTVEDYIDTRQEIKEVKNHLAKVHRAAFEGDNVDDDEAMKALAEHFPKDDSAEELKLWEDYVNTQPKERHDALRSMQQMKALAEHFPKDYSVEELKLWEDYVNTQPMERHKVLRRMQKQQSSRSASIERPVWEQHFPKDSSEQELQKWKDFVNTQPKDTHHALNHLQVQSAHLAEITSQPGIAEEIDKLGAERQDCLSRVSKYRHLERTLAIRLSESVTAQLKAINTGHRNAAFLKATQAGIAAEIDNLNAQKESILSEGDIEATLDELERRSYLDKSRQLDDGLLLTDQMEDIIRAHFNSAIGGKPILIVGETGGAKTALAKEMARRIQAFHGRPDQVDKEPLLFSGSAEANPYDLMGKTGLESDGQGGTVTTFKPGLLAVAMQEGLPIILDEVNAMPPELLKRLNEILLKKPTDTFRLQEDGGLEFVIKPGFCVIYTGNEKSQRYKGVHDLSADLLDRFTGSTVRMPYPDMDVQVGELPPNLLSLALAAVTNEHGVQELPEITTPEGEVLSPEKSLKQFLNFVKVCHITQILFTQPSNSPLFNNSELLKNYSTTDQKREGKTALKLSVLSPRSMVELIKKTQRDPLSLNEVIDGYLVGIKDPDDKELIKIILRGHGFGSEK